MRTIDADALKDGYMHMGYDPNEHPEESYMEGWCKGFNAAVDHCIGHVIHAPTIEPEPKWIPVSERLPKIGKEVLLSEPNDTFLAEYHGNGNPEGVWHIDGIHHFLQDIKGCAWMPLPKPYREEGEKE